MVFISYGTGVVHTLSYLFFVVTSDLLCCRGMGKHRHAVPSSQVREAGRQFVRKLELYFVSLQVPGSWESPKVRLHQLQSTSV